MKINSIFIKGFLIALMLLLPASAAMAQAKPAAGNIDVYEAISRARVYIEFYYMEAGDYPESLEQLDKDLNSLLPKNLEHVAIPKDPATGKSFIYVAGKDRKSYLLKVPDPSKYSGMKLEFVGVPWGGFATIAEERKNRFLQMISIENIKAIATAVEYFAKDNGGKFPKQLKDLIPQYLKSMPVCPVTGQFYVLTVEGENYAIAAPKPDVYGMKEMMFSSTRGWVTQ